MLANLVLPDGSRTGLNALREPSDELPSAELFTGRGLLGFANPMMCSIEIEEPV